MRSRIEFCAQETGVRCVHFRRCRTHGFTGYRANVDCAAYFHQRGGGAFPYAGPILIGGNLYGTTYSGGANYAGTAFELKHQGSGWVLATLYDFLGGQDGDGPYSGVVTGPGGMLYGATYSGGNGYGTVYRLHPPANVCQATDCPWVEDVLYRFLGGNDGAHPGNADALTFDSAGNVYGTTAGDKNADGNIGTVFELSPSNGGWTESVLYRFTRDEQPLAGVTFDAAGNLHGTTSAGGHGYGTVYELSPSSNGWVYQTIYEFQNMGDGATP
ncbi:MAG: choice-of-anchor tandem repeat GloVer-containing protein [Candidatus Korobacteraceae bacterium]